ncbi:MAG TPA: DUF4442 domain-containing protein [Ferruginibacter sp.]|nr:DUF4442 domain-containing protein [Ferruginibacter sp.]
MSNAAGFLRLINNPFKFRIFLFTKLPSAFFAGVRVLTADERTCVVTVPYKWFSQNPFKSTYFACLSMAAEMSTGVLALAHVYKRNPQISMLVLKVQGDFTKKAVGKTTFTCDEGLIIKQTIEDAIATNEGKVITAKSYGRNKSGEIVAQFEITWSFKVKSNIS